MPAAEARPGQHQFWPLGDLVEQQGFTTDAAGKATLKFKLPAGPYRAVLETQDRFGKKVTARLPLQVLKPAAKQFPIKVPDFVGAPKWSLEPNEEFMALWGTGYEKARALHRNRAPPQDHQELLDRKRRHAAIGQAGRHRGDARRLHAACDDGARKPRLSRFAPRRCSVVEQEADRQMGALRLEARAGAKGNLDGGHHRPRREKGGRGNGRRACTTNRWTPICRTLAEGVQRLPPGQLEAAIPIREHRACTCSRCSAIGRWITRRSKSRIVIFRSTSFRRSTWICMASAACEECNGEGDERCDGWGGWSGDAAAAMAPMAPMAAAQGDVRRRQAKFARQRATGLRQEVSRQAGSRSRPRCLPVRRVPI